MPRSEDVLSIFLASPNDVAEERSRFADVVSEWNRTWSRNLGLRLELIRWEDDAYPAVGEDAQDVINHQVPDHCDLFVGIMWARFGTPTGRAGSGTQEEFDRTMERRRIAPNTMNILFYFKDAPIAPSKIDTEQLLRVQEFKNSLAARGVLTWDFADPDQFEKLVNLHLTRHVQEWRRLKDGSSVLMSMATPTRPEESGTSIGNSPPSDSSAEADDSGYLDLLEVFNERSAEMSEIAVRITAAQHELTEQNRKTTKELDAMRANPVNVSPANARSAIARVADEMLRFTKRVEAEVPLFHAATDSSMNALIRLATIAAELYPEQKEATKAAAVHLLENLIVARQSMEGFRQSTATLPRMTKELNVAKRKQVTALDALIVEFVNGERLLAEGLTVIDGLPGSAPTP